MAQHEDWRLEKHNIRRLKNITAAVAEQSKIKLDDILQKFHADETLTDFTFPPNLTNIERAHIHYQSGRLGFKSSSNGVGEERRITITKVRQNTVSIVKALELNPRSRESLQKIVELFRPANFLAVSKRDKVQEDRSGLVESSKSGFTSRVSAGPFPKVPKPKSSNKFDASRHQLPIWKYKGKILQLVENHKVTFIKGDTGCGKTTQVPQFILEDATQNRKKVRVLCTVPRRIAAVSISDRVAAERGERVGNTVGYQIRLESKISPTETLLTYCTSGVLLRSLASFDYTILKNTTHIIIDEVHERDRQTDFLLACLRDIGQNFPHLRVILMGADMDSQLLVRYFGGPESCPLLEVEGRLYPVQIMFLEDILELLNYQNFEMKVNKENRGRSKSDVLQGLVNKLKPESSNHHQDHLANKMKSMKIASPNLEADELIQRVWVKGDTNAMDQFLNLAKKNPGFLDYQHSQHQVTMLMAIAVRGFMEYATSLLSLGANVNLQMVHENYPQPLTAKMWAKNHGQEEMAKFLSDREFTDVLKPSTSSMTIGSSDSRRKERLLKYQTSVDDERVDLPLTLRLLYQIHLSTDTSHAVLVFLPGYEEIVTLKQMLFMDPMMANRSNSFVVYLLHSNIQTGDQKAAFEKPRRGVRKILLSTNIAETSLTIEDVVYVIDSGKAKEKSYDTMTGVSQLKSNWISKASANQRQGRAGRCRAGICYRLYSTSRYESMSAFPTPEIVRSSLQELCLYTRAFITGKHKVADFFSRLPEPPAPIAVKKAVDMLIAMGALDDTEQLTKMGLYLLDFPVEPSLGKALIYAAVMKCLDPILTIVSFVSYRDPFQLPADPSEKQRALESKFQFASGSMSDHMATLKAYRDWEKAYVDGADHRFCRDNYVSSACFEMVYGIRTQLLGQLRACKLVKTRGPGDLRDLNVNSENWALVKGVLTGTMYPHVCAVSREKKCLYNEFDSKISFHQSSTVVMKQRKGVLSLPNDWVVYDEMCQQGSGRLVRGCTSVGDAAMAVFAGQCKSNLTQVSTGGLTAAKFDPRKDRKKLEPTLRLEINPWISFQGPQRVMDGIRHLREGLQDVVFNKLKNPSYKNSDIDEAVLRTIASVLNAEEEIPKSTAAQAITEELNSSEEEELKDPNPNVILRVATPTRKP